MWTMQLDNFREMVDVQWKDLCIAKWEEVTFSQEKTHKAALELKHEVINEATAREQHARSAWQGRAG